MIKIILQSTIAMIISGCTVIVLLIVMGLCYQYFSTKIDNYRYPAPGKLIDIGGHKLHSYCVGTGRFTVILDAGLGANLTWWSLVQKEVSQFARVCSFDRAGYGWSDKGNKPRTSTIIVDELHELLQRTSDTPPPYILVGHSFGGANMRLYANTYPEDVFGLVLVDSTHEKQYRRLEKYKKKSFTLKASLLSRVKDYILKSKFAHYTGITRLLMPQSMKSFFADSFPKDLQEIIIAKASAVKSLETRDSEWANIKESLRQIEKSTNRLVDKPLIVISQGKTGEQALDAIWLKCQQDLAGMSKKCKHIFATKSGHMINVEQPEIIVEAIHELVKKYAERNNV